MNAVTPIVRLHQHRLWSNDQLREACRPLSEKQLRQEHAIGQGTLWRTLCHMYAAEFVWLKALCGTAEALAPGDVADDLPGNQKGPDAARNLLQLNGRWDELNGQWESYLYGLTPEKLSKKIYKKPSRGVQTQVVGASTMDVLLHVCTHAQYTTAQAVNMLRHLGIEKLPPTMLITLAREEAKG